MTTDIHSCSLYCDRPACIKAQRDQMRDEFAHPQVPLTEEEITKILSFYNMAALPHRVAACRAIERKHGIGEKK